MRLRPKLVVSVWLIVAAALVLTGLVLAFSGSPATKSTVEMQSGTAWIIQASKDPATSGSLELEHVNGASRRVNYRSILGKYEPNQVRLAQADEDVVTLAGGVLKRHSAWTSAPIELASGLAQDEHTHLTLSGAHAYVALTGGSLLRFDSRQQAPPAKYPNKLGSIDELVPDGLGGVYFLADDELGSHVINWKGGPTKTVSAPLNPRPSALTMIGGKVAAVADGAVGASISTFDRSLATTRTRTLRSVQQWSSIARTAGSLVGVSGTSLLNCRLSDNRCRRPAELGSGEWGRPEVVGGFAYVASKSGGLRMVNLETMRVTPETIAGAVADESVVLFVSNGQPWYHYRQRRIAGIIGRSAPFSTEPSADTISGAALDSALEGFPSGRSGLGGSTSRGGEPAGPDGPTVAGVTITPPTTSPRGANLGSDPGGPSPGSKWSVRIGRPSTITVGATASFEIVVSGGRLSSARWRLPDGSEPVGETATFTFNQVGTFQISVTATDTTNQPATAFADVTVLELEGLVARIGLSKTTVKVGETITLTDRSSGAVSRREWDVSEGPITKSQFNYSWPTVGTKTVRLSVWHNAEGPAVATRTVDVVQDDPPVKALFTISTATPQINQDVILTDTSQGSPTAWDWDLGDGGRRSDSRITYRWTRSGTFPITLTARRGATQDTKQVVVKVTEPIGPVTADFTFSKDPASVGEMVTVTAIDPSATGWVWDFDDGTPPGTGRVVNHKWSSAGVKTVRLTVTRASDGDEKTTPGRLVIGPATTGVTASFKSTATTVLTGEVVMFSDTSTGAPDSWNWTFEDGPGKIGRDVSKSWPNAGTYTVTLVAARSDGASDSWQMTMTVMARPALTAAFSVDPSSPIQGQEVTLTDTSSGEPTSWSWTFGDGGTDNGPTVRKIWTGPGLFPVVLRVTRTADNAEDDAFKNVQVQPIPVGSIGNLRIGSSNNEANYWVGTPATLTAISTGGDSQGPADSWLWTFGDGTQATGQSVTKTFSEAGGVSIELTARRSSDGATEKASSLANVWPRPVVHIIANRTSVGVGEVVQLTVVSNLLVSQVAGDVKFRLGSEGMLTSQNGYSAQAQWSTPGPHQVSASMFYGDLTRGGLGASTDPITITVTTQAKPSIGTIFAEPQGDGTYKFSAPGSDRCVTTQWTLSGATNGSHYDDPRTNTDGFSVDGCWTVELVWWTSWKGLVLNPGQHTVTLTTTSTKNGQSNTKSLPFMVP